MGSRLITGLSLLCATVSLAPGAFGLEAAGPGVSADEKPLFHDAHFHLTNYVQEGTDVRDFLDMMGDTIGRSTLFGIPLQQTWSYENSGDYKPTYYLHTDAPLYYYSFTDAVIATAYRSLTTEQQVRIDPMITGFNPADMYAADHIRRVLETFPGVFTGIGEFTIHKEFVSSKVAGDVASLTDPALDRIFAFAGEVGLVAILHNDIDVPFAKDDEEPAYLSQLRELLRRHPETTIIWAHVGLGRVVHPVGLASAPAAARSPRQLQVVQQILSDPGLDHVYFDISWNETAKYATASPEVIQRVADTLNRYPDRFLFGTDVVAPASVEAMVAVYDAYAPIWALLTPDARYQVTKGNYERLFDQARTRVRAWESVNLQPRSKP